jgi:hypothetical protein
VRFVCLCGAFDAEKASIESALVLRIRLSLSKGVSLKTLGILLEKTNQ